MTLAINVDNLKKKNDELKSAAQKAEAALSQEMAKVFDLEGSINTSKADAAAAKKATEEARAKAKRDVEAATSKLANLETRAKVILNS